MLLLYSCQKRTTQEMTTIIMIITKVGQEGSGVETEMIAIRHKRILNGLGIVIRRSRHQDSGFSALKIFSPAHLRLSSTS